MALAGAKDGSPQENDANRWQLVPEPLILFC